ncbi:MAG: DUF4124 domain-containing protein [Gammaproteobacteria bacterium]
MRSRTDRPKLPFLSAGLAILGLLFAGPLWAQHIYRWVGPHGTVHYSDVPHGSRYQRIHVELPSTFSMPGSSRHPAPKPVIQAKKHVAPAKKVPGLTPAQAQAFCRVARQRYHKLEPVRRLQLVEPNGKSKFLSGQNLQSYKDAARSRMQLFCGQAKHPSA